MQHAFIRNRAEEFDHDVWSTYVLPLYFPSLGLDDARKSCVLQGGRGCGKTALLRYLSYQSQFSRHRADIPEDALRTIGLYLKADSQYFSGFTGSSIEETQWQNVFEHALCLALAERIIGAVRSLNLGVDRSSKYGQLADLNFTDAVQGFTGAPVPPDFASFEKWLQTQRQQLSRWFKNFDFEPPPTLFPLLHFLNSLIGEIRSKLPYLANSVFAVYVDEYENLLDYQQRFLNTLIKGGEQPLIFHVAMKPNGMRTRATIGTESIQETSDFRLIKLDEMLEPSFKLFCAELFFFRLINEIRFPESETPVSSERLRSVACLSYRAQDVAYQQRVLTEIERILPGTRYAEIATNIVRKDGPLHRRWRKIVEEGLGQQQSPLRPEAFVDPKWPEATIVCAALLHQRSKTAAEVLHEFEKLQRGESSKFREGDWVHHLLLGTLLLLYLPLRQQPCPIYAGFDTFVRLSRTSVRHFLELCHLSIGDFSPKNGLGEFSVPIDDQADAAARASRKFRGEVSSCGDQGNRLYALVNFLGKVFRMSQGRYSQSEFERTHFSIVGDELSTEADAVLKEAIKWSVVFEVPETKVKGVRYESSDYVLNPIYAPFFGVSFNKGRKLEIPTAEAETMLCGRLEEFTKLLREYEKSWGVASTDQLSLDLES